MTTTTFVDVEDVVKEWALAQSDITAVTNKIFLAMPKGSPLPSIVLSRVGGAPQGGNVPEDVARITFDCWANNRTTAKAAAVALVSAIDRLNAAPFSASNGGLIVGAQVVLWLWQPDAAAEISRYVVDADFTVIAR